MILDSLRREPLRFQAAIQLNLEAKPVVSVLGSLASASTAIDDCRHVCTGFSARFFSGPLTSSRDGNRTGARVPAIIPTGLGQMRCRGDNGFDGVSTDVALAIAESDVIVSIESDTEQGLRAAIRTISKVAGLRVVGAHTGYKGDRERALLGVCDGISNLRDADTPEVERAVLSRDGMAGSPKYDGGTYMVFRKYKLDRRRWWDPGLTVPGLSACGESAREAILGRSGVDDLVVHAITGQHLPPEPDEAQGIYANPRSHVRKANPRCRGTTSFGDAIAVPNIRMLRRGFAFEEATVEGHVFVSYQAQLRDSGFEFVHNNWLMSDLLGGPDFLMNPASRLVEPLTGCYYFVPPAREFPGDIFVALT